ncbi:MAG: hypothetical protein COX77_04560 [Candidatus Komeilibacteria bacterium CG_4_10_14_0_2_um_filter_37_10]|uniref:Uncharacterized protein n=1 Tax=Candidatus Komeilibacteria bacterium CG_4_10_14_0_2_um_filter_37_10 TaxID=1974470 RepID=A0A2M7VDC4_9BACT|nr:MAG: hypothetical protein COX77_04560 [Candidatus Komeilibacteria bacterium CG_4_10_14_0_2_um_filter_37_10]
MLWLKINSFIQNKLLIGWRPYLVLAVIILLLYAPSLNYDYHYLDDNVLIKDNFSRLTDLRYFYKSFTEGAFHSPNGSELYYRPLLNISFVIDALWHANSLFFFHLTDILLHILVSWLIALALIEFKLSRLQSFLWALLFAVHPINLQAIAWLPGRNDPLVAIVILAALINFLRAINHNRAKNFWLFWFFYLLSLFTKETAIVFPALCLLYLWLIKKEKLFGPLSIKIGLLYVIITIPWWLLRSLVIPEPISSSYDIAASLTANVWGIIPYLGKIIWPFNLSVFPVLTDTPLIYGILTIALFIGLFWWQKDKKNTRLVLWGLAWFLLFLLPALIRPLSSLADFSEHRVYLPLFGIIIALYSLQLKWPIKLQKLSWLTPVVYTTVLLILIVVNIAHAPVYQNKISFWSDAVDNSPNSSFNRNNLGAMYYLDGRYQEAATQWEKTLQLNPNEPLTRNNLGLLYARSGQYAEAEKMYLAENALNPYYDDAYFNLGLLYYAQKKVDSAVAAWQKTIDVNPENWDAYNNIAFVYLDNQRIAEAQRYIDLLKQRGGPILPILQEAIDKNRQK